MIVKRNRPRKATSVPRTIVRRGASVGRKAPRMIVKRQRQGSGLPPRSWRPSWLHRPHPNRRWVWGVAAVTAGGLLVSGAAWLWQSPIFRVNHLEVVGNERVGTDVVVEQADLLGESMFTADLAAAQKAIYQHPLVHAVNVERKWPSTLRIVIEERKAWGTWEQESVRYTIDRDGVVLGTVPPPPGSPVIRSSAQGSKRQGDRVDYQAVDAAAEIYERLPRQLGTTVTEVAYLAGKGVQVTTSEGETALFGDSSAIAYKLAVWAALKREAQVHGLNYSSIDLRYGNRPVLQ